MTALVDTHTHLFAEEFDADRPQVILRAREAGVGAFFIPNIDDTSVQALLNLCDAYPDCFPMIGFHPTSVDADWKKRLSTVEDVLRSGYRFYGIGEVGMDLYWEQAFRTEQMEVLDIQINWAIEFGLPLIIHCRDAYPELLKVLSAYPKETLRGIFHSFTGTAEQAAQLMEYTGFMLGVNGIATFKKAAVAEVLSQSVPLSRLVLETDSPYLAPVPYRGKRNESAYLIHVAQKIADLYRVEIQEVARITSQNAGQIFPDIPLVFPSALNG